MGCSFYVPTHKTQRPDRPITVGDKKVLMIKKIAQGAYGNIWLCQSCTTGEKYAMKEIPLKMDLIQNIDGIDALMQQKLKDHKFKGSIEMISHGLKAHKLIGTIGRILLELGQTSLFNQINQKDFSKLEKLIIIRDLSQDLREVHSLGDCFFDLKPENVLYANGRYKLCDFGSYLENKVDFDKLSYPEKIEFKDYIDRNSTISYKAPEMIQPEGKIIGPATDIWMLGCISYILDYNKHPFEDKTETAMLRAQVDYPKQQFLTDLTKKMLRVQASQRPTADEIIQEVNIQIDMIKRTDGIG